MPRKERDIKVTILNPPKTPEEQKAFQKRSAKALALALYRSLTPELFDALIIALREWNRKSDKGGRRLDIHIT